MIGIAVLGCGVVGSGVVKMLTENREIISRAAGTPVSLTHIVDIRPVAAPEGVRVTKDFQEALGDPRVRVVAETIGGARIAYEYTKRALEKGVSVVTSNKELVAAHGAELTELACRTGCRYLYEAAVGGGIPVLRPIARDLSANRLSRVAGIVNGSTNYLLTRMEEMGVGFSAALEEAKRLGYVEADPSADVDGVDARRKLAILAHTAFGSALSDDQKIPNTGISRVTERDFLCAHALGGTVRLIASGERTPAGWRGWVAPAFVDEKCPLSDVRGVFNGILVRGDFVGEVLFYGQGAGSLATASAVLGDIVDLAAHPLDGCPGGRFDAAPAFEDPNKGSARFAFRAEAEDLDAAARAVAEALPGAAVQAAGDMLTVITAEGPAAELLQKIAALGESGLRAGQPLRVFA